MRDSVAENSFKKGMAAFSAEQYAEATALFESAMRLEKERTEGKTGTRMRYLSYYGLASSLATRATPEAIRACEVAARKEFLSAELHLNLGKVYLLAGKMTRALATLEHGLRLAPRNKEMRALLARYDRRGGIAVPWFGRNHPINRFFGRVRSSMRDRAARRPQEGGG